MGRERNDDGSEVEKDVDYNSPEYGEHPNVPDEVERVNPLFGSVVNGLHVQGWESRRRVSIRGAAERHLHDIWVSMISQYVWGT